MKAFEFLNPVELKQASRINFKNKNTSMLFAGGTDILGLMKDKILSPEKLINLKALKNLEFIEREPNGAIRIGALTKLSDIASDKKIRADFTALAEAAAQVGTPQLRNVGTIAGNVCQRPRCFYFRGDFNCLRKGGGECFAVSGNNKYHCIEGGGPCYIIHPSDTAAALTLFNAEVKIYSDGKYRSVRINDFFVLPEEDHTKENILEPGEIITEFIIPKHNFTFSKYIKVKERGAWDFALVSLAAAVRGNKSKIEKAEFVFGGVAPVPWIDHKLNNTAKNFSISGKKFNDLKNTAFNNAEPMEMNGFKIHLARNLIIKMLTQSFNAASDKNIYYKGE